MRGCLASLMSFSLRRSERGLRRALTRPRKSLRIVLMITMAGLCASAHAKDLEPTLTNDDFAVWERDGTPRGWQKGVGAKRGVGSASRIQPRKGGGVSLTGDDDTSTWHMLSQRVAVDGDAVYRLHIVAGTERIVLADGQRPNCYVGLFFYDASGQRLQMAIRTLRSPEIRTETLVAAAPSRARSADIVIFLSMSGTLIVRSVRLERLHAKQSLAILEDEVSRHYSFLHAHKIDWRAQFGEARARLELATDAEVFAREAAKLLSKFQDPHVIVATPSGQDIPTVDGPTKRQQASARRWAQGFERGVIWPKLAMFEREPTDIGAILIAKLPSDQKSASAMLTVWERQLKCIALLVDLRGNGGGNEALAQKMVGRLTAKPIVYAKSVRRCGPKPGQLCPDPPRVLRPVGRSPVNIPVAVLVGPGCMSSGEGMALMFRALPHARLFGQPTRGASGNPVSLPLPNGVTVRYSTWMTYLPDGTALERKGVPPDELIAESDNGDAVRERALAWLKKQLEASK